MIIQVIVTTMAALALLVGVSAACLAVIHLTRRRLVLSAFVAKHLEPNAIALALVPSVLSTLGSLWLQFGPMQLVPCLWCWVQRGFIYLQVLVLIAALALYGRRIMLARVSSILAVVGGLVSLYHIAIERIPTLSTVCSIAQRACTVIQVQEFGFVTIPTMAFFVQMMVLALTVFVALPSRD